MPAYRDIDISSTRRSRRLSKQEPRNYAEDGLELYDLLYPASITDVADAPPSVTTTALASSLSSSNTPSPLSASLSSPELVRASHSRRRQKGHISRPPNAFMLFRSDFWAKEKQKEVPIERDHRDISRIAGHCWNNLSGEEKARYQRLAAQRKQMHTIENPGYKYAPAARKDRAPKRKAKKGNEEEEERCRQLATLVMEGVSHADLREAMKDIKKKPVEKSSSKQPTPGPSRSARPTSGQHRHQSPAPGPEGSIKLEPTSPSQVFDAFDAYGIAKSLSGIEEIIHSGSPLIAKGESCVDMASSIRPPSYDAIDPQFEPSQQAIPYFASEYGLWYGPEGLGAIPVEGLDSIDFATAFTNPFDSYPILGNDLSFSANYGSAFADNFEPFRSCLEKDGKATLDPFDSELNQYLHFDY
ncbi:Transcription factor ste11 [Hypsizygus marmoreus]|uniref:Transcription factor ste11 n=1 Tax=Hypsizygus marmoreus TaxID=39966 RepID=A0A369KDH4_HYPMA|nr:Transcription factor ste11 [Hypsizygus marmoreus]